MVENVSHPVDFSAADSEVSERLDSAFVKNGYALVTGLLPAQYSATAQMVSACDDFFNLKLSQKLRWRRRGGVDWQGYFPIDESLRAFGEQVERLEYGRQDIVAAELGTFGSRLGIPTDPYPIAPHWASYYRSMEQTVDRLFYLTHRLIGLSSSALADWTTRHASELSVNFFPHYEKDHHRRGVGLKSHTDFGGFTILAIRGSWPVLEIANDLDSWDAIYPTEDQYLIQVGDLLSMASGRRWPARQHRVFYGNPREEVRDARRISLAYFHLPNLSMPVDGWDDLPGGTVSDYLRSRVSSY